MLHDLLLVSGKLLLALVFVGLFSWAWWLVGWNHRKEYSLYGKAMSHLLDIVMDVIVFQFGMVTAGLTALSSEREITSLYFDGDDIALFLLVIFASIDLWIRSRSMKRQGMSLFEMMREMKGQPAETEA